MSSHLTKRLHSLTERAQRRKKDGVVEHENWRLRASHDHACPEAMIEERLGLILDRKGIEAIIVCQRFDSIDDDE